MKAPHPIDRLVRTRLPLRRMQLGISQTALGEAVGVTFQQIRKYERGVNRVSASMLCDFTQTLDVPVAWFFDEGVLFSPIANTGPTAIA